MSIEAFLATVPSVFKRSQDGDCPDSLCYEPNQLSCMEKFLKLSASLIFTNAQKRATVQYSKNEVIKKVIKKDVKGQVDDVMTILQCSCNLAMYLCEY